MTVISSIFVLAKQFFKVCGRFESNLNVLITLSQVLR